MGDEDHRALVLLQVRLEPRDRLGVEVVGGLVEEQQVGVLQEELAERNAAALAAGELGDARVHRRDLQGVGGLLKAAVQVPDALRIHVGLQAVILERELLGLLALGVAHDRHDLVVARLDGAQPGDRLVDVLADGLLLVEGRFLLEVADGEALDGAGHALDVLVLAREDPEQGALARAVRADEPDVGALQEGDGDAREHLPLVIELLEVLELVDDLRFAHGCLLTPLGGSEGE